MLSRGFIDALAIWPAVIWPIVSASAFLAFLRICMIRRQRYGFSVLNGRRGSDAVSRAYLLGGGVFEVLMQLYLLRVIGASYALAAAPVAALGWLALPVLLDEIGPAQPLLAALHILFAAALLVLLGFADIGFLRVLNSELYTLLTGVPVTL